MSDRSMQAGERKVGLEEAASKFGFTVRDVPLGFFLAPVTVNRFGHRHVGDDQMLVKHSGEIVPYADSAQAFLAARAVSAVIASRCPSCGSLYAKGDCGGKPTALSKPTQAQGGGND